jgi:hypothetical protein
MSTYIPATGRHYLCVDNPQSNSHFVQVEILGWHIKGDGVQPIPITAFGPADMEREVLVCEDNGTTQGVWYFLPNGPFLKDYSDAKRALTHLTNGGKI